MGPSDRFVLDTFDREEYRPLIHQWRDVFRYMAGGQVILFDDSKSEVLALIEIITNTRVSLVVLERQDTPVVKSVSRSSSVKSKGVKKVAGKKSVKGSANVNGAGMESGEIYLYISVLKGDNFDMVVQKTTELGVDHIVPFISDRTIKKNLNLERLRKIAIEASEQSGRRTVPNIHEIVKFSDIIEHAHEQMDGLLHMESYLFVIKMVRISCLQVMHQAKKGSIAYIVGPEGGWSPKEEKVFENASAEGKIKKISISKNVLRAETAGILVAGLRGLI
jgi:16S rRNA (uracil1498-N3)-methyltransferase